MFNSIYLRYILFILIGIIIGFFGGREYFKYEIRTALQSAFHMYDNGAPNARNENKKITVPQDIPKDNLIETKLVSKGFQPSDPGAGMYGAYITLDLVFTNLTHQDIRAFEGNLIFYDLLDRQIFISSISIMDPIKAGSDLNWRGSIKYNQFISEYQQLRDEKQENLKIKFLIKKILFEDGTTKDY